MEYDRERVTRLAAEISSALQSLREIGAATEEEFLADPRSIAAAKYHLIVSIEASVDLCTHLISRNRFRAPEDYADTFRVLRENGVLPGDLTDRLINMAKFRNRLVHRYWNVDDTYIYALISHDIADISLLMDTLLDALS